LTAELAAEEPAAHNPHNPVAIFRSAGALCWFCC